MLQQMCILHLAYGFQHIFATYFYREEFTGLRYRHFADSVDKGLRRVASGDKTERTDSKRATMRTELTYVDERVSWLS